MSLFRGIGLIQPKWLETKNRWQRRRRDAGARGRAICILGVVLSMSIGIYYGTSLGLHKIAASSSLLYISPRIPIAILFLFLFLMLLLSGTVNAIGRFFLSQDNELLLASPITRTQFFVIKFFDVFVSTIWMPLGFIVPFLLAYGVFYQAPLRFIVFSLLVLLPFFLSAISTAIVIAHSIVFLVPPRRLRWLIYSVVLLFAFFIFQATKIIVSGAQSAEGIRFMSVLFSQFSLSNMLWLPSQWVALTLDDALASRNLYHWHPMILLWSGAVLFMSLAFLVFAGSFSFNSQGVLHARAHSAWQQRVLNRILRPFADYVSENFMVKDFRLLYRDIPQLLQILLLLIIYSTYLSQLHVLGVMEIIDSEHRPLWNIFFYIVNTSVAAFITIAAAARLVFPAISLEGSAFWILQTAPISMSEILKRKFWTWYPVLGALACLTFTAGNIALGAGMKVILSTFLVSWILTGTIVSLGLALGAYCARFDWEHTAELVASFGSFIFMIVSILVVALTMVPLGIVLYARCPGMFGYAMSNTEWNIFVLISAGVVLGMNMFLTRKSFFFGAKALQSRRWE
jgi:ABC-2 type transport system permease protein